MGMDGKRHSEKTKRKMSVACKGERNHNYGKSLSEETKKKMSATRKGKCFSEEHKKKLSIACMGRKNHNYGKHLSEDHKRRLRESIKGEKCHKWKGGISKNKQHKLELSRIAKHKRRALLKNSLGSFTIGEWELLKKQYNYTCPSCGKKEPIIQLSVDHIIPISKGGCSYIENIQPLCTICNSKKRARIYRVNNKNNQQFGLF